MLTTARRRVALLFAASSMLRLAFWLATPDRAGAAALAYTGDAEVWLRHAAASAAFEVECVLPFRPPAMAWLVDALVAGEPAQASLVPARLTMVLLGAMIAPLVYLVLRAHFAERVALLAGAVCAVSTNLVLLGCGLHSEVPYLLLFLLSVPDFVRLQERTSTPCAVRWALLQAAACLFRTDHLLFVAAALGWLALRRRAGWPRHTVVAVATMAVALAPWQWHAHAAVERANREGLPGRPPAALPLPRALAWSSEALAAIDAMPAFARTASFAFVDATMRTRGATKVDAGDLAVLDEAYGCRPEPLATPPLVLYGPLNFFLANCAESTGGFTRAALDRAPQLAGGPSRYPAGLVLPNELALDYPPHLHAILHGYELGFAWLAAHPRDAAALAWRKLVLAWRGAATGVLSHGVPMGLSGVREPVDLVAAEHTVATVWRVLLLALAIAGLWCGRGQAAAAPWLLWLATKLATVLLFFGYARLGALCVPALALLWSLALDRWWLAGRSPRWRRTAAATLIALAAALEVHRAATVRTPQIDGRPPASRAEASTFDRVHVRY